MDESELPLFPLSTVLFPGGPLPLRIFEPRYLDMVSRCLKTDSGFGVVAIRSGRETGAARTFSVGTLAHITNWYQDDDGLLAITTLARGRFRIESSERRGDGLYVGRVTRLAPEPALPLPEPHGALADVLAGLLKQLGPRYRGVETDFGDASWVGYRLAEILPIPLELKQRLLETDDAVERLERLAPIVDRLRTPSTE